MISEPNGRRAPKLGGPLGADQGSAIGIGRFSGDIVDIAATQSDIRQFTVAEFAQLAVCLTESPLFVDPCGQLVHPVSSVFEYAAQAMCV